MGELQGGFTNNSILLLVKFFQSLDNVVRIYDKIQFVYKEMTHFFAERTWRVNRVTRAL